MSKLPSTIEGRLQFKLLDADAKDGKYQFVAEQRAGFALVRFRDGSWSYPGGEPLDFVPTHYRPASAVMKPEGGDE